MAHCRKADVFDNYMPVPEAGCWLWLGYWRPNGYGIVGKQQEGAHRLFFEKSIGRELDRREFVCHKCDTPACVNPSHMFVGTHGDNMRDMARKGRGGGSKITPDVARELRSKYPIAPRRSGCVAIGREYGVSGVAIYKILTNRSWRLV